MNWRKLKETQNTTIETILNVPELGIQSRSFITRCKWKGIKKKNASYDAATSVSLSCPSSTGIPNNSLRTASFSDNGLSVRTMPSANSRGKGRFLLLAWIWGSIRVSSSFSSIFFTRHKGGLPLKSLYREHWKNIDKGQMILLRWNTEKLQMTFFSEHSQSQIKGESIFRKAL